MESSKNVGKFLEVIDNLDRKGKYVPGLIMSHPGMGKTTLISKWCEYKGYNLVTVVPSTCAPDDILGLQSVIDNRLVRLTPSWFNRLVKESKKGRTVLFLDELTTCSEMLQGPLLNLIFNRDLGEETLPENCLVVAAGNYSEDLNGAFTMMAPMVNRFMILNLQNSDFDLDEVMDDEFEELTSKEEIKKYLGLTDEGKTKFDYELFKNWVKESGEVVMGKCEASEEEGFGLLGFTSIRSLAFSKTFVREYMEEFHDDLWSRIVGDTLGRSNKRENKPMRNVLATNLHKFTATKKSTTNYTIKEVCGMIEKEGITNNNIFILSELIEKTNNSTISSADLSNLTKVFTKYWADDRVQRLNKILMNNLESY